VQAVREAPAT